MANTKHHVIHILIALAAIAGISAVFYSHSGRYDSEVVQGYEAPQTLREASNDTPLVIALPSDEKNVAGIVLYAADEKTAETMLAVTIQDKDGQTLATKRRQITYYQQDGSAAMHVYFPEQRYLKEQKAFITITPFGNETASFIATPSSTLVYSLLYPEDVSDGTKQGVLIGAALAISLLLHYSIRIRDKWKWVSAAVIVCIFSILATLPYTNRPAHWGIYDWDYRHSLSHIYQTTIREFNQVPLWNPYICGGAASLGDPELSLFTPSFLLQFIFGVENGTGYALTLGFIITGLGMLTLARALKLDSFSALISAITVTFSTALFLKATEGHTTIIFAYMWVPWVFWAWYMAYRTAYRRWPLLCGIFLSLAMLQGGIYIVSYTALSLLGLCIISPRRLYATQISLYAMLWMGGITSFQLIPSLAWVREFPDQAFVGSAYTYTRLWDIFFRRNLQHVFAIPNQVSRWHEYGAYIGYGVFALILIGISYAKSSKIVRILLIGTLATLTVSTLGPLLEPVLGYMKFLPRSNISRLVLFSLLCGGLLAGFGMKRVLAIVPSQLKMIPVIVAAFIAIDLISISYPIAEQGFSVPRVFDDLPKSSKPISHTTETFEIRHNGSDTPRAYAATLKGYGTLSFCSVIGPTPTAPQGPFIQSSEEVQTELLSWSPNSITFSYFSQDSADISLNTNHAQGWRTNRGQIDRTNPLLTIHVPGGKDTVTVHYRPPGMVLGILLSVITLVVVFRNRKYLIYKR